MQQQRGTPPLHGSRGHGRSHHTRRGGASAASTRGHLRVSESLLHIVGIPLIVLGVVAVGFVLVYLKDILVPFVVAVFFVYLLRPVVNTLTKPCGSCSFCCCCASCAEEAEAEARRIKAAAEHARLYGSGGEEHVGGGVIGGDVGYTDDNDSSTDLLHGEKGHGGLAAGGGDVLSVSIVRRERTPSSDGGGGGGGVGGGGGGGASTRIGSSSVGGIELTQVAIESSPELRGVAMPAQHASFNSAQDLSSDALGGGAAVLAADIGNGHGEQPDDDADGTGSDQIPLTTDWRSPFVRDSGDKAGASGMRRSRSRSSRNSPYRAVGGGGGGGGGGSGAGAGAGSRQAHAGQAPKRCCRVTRCPRWMAVLVALLLVGGVLSGLVLLVADAVQTFEHDDLKVFSDNAEKVADRLQKWLQRVFDVDGRLMLDSIREQLDVPSIVQSVLVVLIDTVGNTLLILLFVLYLLFEQEAHPKHSLRGKIDDQIERYIGIKTMISGMVGGAVYVILGPILSVKMAHLFGVLTFLMNYIPNVGPILATMLPLPVIILDPALSSTAMVLAMVLPTALHMVVGNVVEPKWFGHSLELHPVVVLLALAFWFAIWGVPGAILSIPITAVMRIVLSHTRHPYAVVIIRLLSGRLGGTSSSRRRRLRVTATAATRGQRGARRGGGGGGGRSGGAARATVTASAGGLWEPHSVSQEPHGSASVQLV